MPRESCLLVIWEPTHDFAVRPAIVNIFQGKFVEIENYMELAVSIQTNIIEKVIARARVPILLRRVRQSLSRALGEQLRGAISFFSHQQQCARHELRLAETVD